MPVKLGHLQRRTCSAHRNDRAMIRQICSIKPEDVARVRSSELLAKLQLEGLDLIFRERRLRWFGHVERSSGAIRTAYDMQIDGKRGAGRPKQTWKKLTEKDCREWKLTTVDPQERSTWRSGVRSAMRAASQLPGKGPTDVDDAPAPAGKSKIWLWYDMITSIKKQRKLWITTVFSLATHVAVLLIVCAVYFVLVLIGYTLL